MQKGKMKTPPGLKKSVKSSTGTHSPNENSPSQSFSRQVRYIVNDKNHANELKSKNTFSDRSPPMNIEGVNQRRKTTGKLTVKPLAANVEDDESAECIEEQSSESLDI